MTMTLDCQGGRRNGIRKGQEDRHFGGSEMQDAYKKHYMVGSLPGSKMTADKMMDYIF